MITAQDIRDKTFEKATFNGYSMNDVDDFLEDLANDLAAVQKENATLRGKMKVLVDKIEEYRASESAMQMALVSAQKVATQIQQDAQAQADALLSDAQAQADGMLADAQARADEICGDTRTLADKEERRLQTAKANAAEYIRNMRLITEKEMTFLDALKGMDMGDEAIVTPAPAELRAIAEPVPPVEDTEYFRDFESSVGSAAEMAEEPAEIEIDDAIPAAEEDDEPTRSFRF